MPLSPSVTGTYARYSMGLLNEEGLRTIIPFEKGLHFPGKMDQLTFGGNMKRDGFVYAKVNSKPGTMSWEGGL